MKPTGVEVEKARALLHQVAEGATDLLVAVSEAGYYRFVSSTGCSVYGWLPADLVGKPQASFTHPDDEAVVVEANRRLLNDSVDSVTTVQRFRCKDGTFRWMESRSRADEGGDERMVISSMRDVTDRRESELDLHRRAATDPLTGIANREVFMDRLRHALARLDRHRGLVAVLFLDLDRFKLVNDSVGHHVGDAVLQQMAQRLLRMLRPEDTVARLGGDEFAVILEDLDGAEGAIAIGQRIVEVGRWPFLVGGEQFVCTTSVGIAITSDADHSSEGLLQESDLALYRAKGRGRDRADVFDEHLRTRAVKRLSTERMLRGAIALDQLRVYYQPIIALDTGRTVAAEALLRVMGQHEPDVIEAELFIDVAQEAGLLATMDEWMLRKVIAQVAAWRNKFPARALDNVAINITARHLADASFVQTVIGELATHQLSAASLQIEVTERVLMEASNSAMTALKSLRVAGVRVGFDDFGTGYSSLSYLRSFPLDFVKIDRSFVAELTHNGGAGPAIVRSIVDLSHALGMAVVAEGVETAAQQHELVTLGCDLAQGYRFSAAVPASEFERFLVQPGSGDATSDDSKIVDPAH